MTKTRNSQVFYFFADAVEKLPSVIVFIVPNLQDRLAAIQNAS